MTTKLEREYRKLLADEHRAFVRYRLADRKQTRHARVERHGFITLVFIDAPRRRIREYHAASKKRYEFEQAHPSMKQGDAR